MNLSLRRDVKSPSHLHVDRIMQANESMNDHPTRNTNIITNNPNIIRNNLNLITNHTSMNPSMELSPTNSTLNAQPSPSTTLSINPIDSINQINASLQLNSPQDNLGLNLNNNNNNSCSKNSNSIQSNDQHDDCQVVLGKPAMSRC